VRLAYVMPVHRAPRQVLRLVDRLTADGSVVFLHVDARAAAAVEAELREGLRGRPTVRFLERRPCYWGGFGIVDVALRAFETLLAEHVPFDYTLAVTGQDYPLAPSPRIHARLEAARGRSFLGAVPLPAPFWPGGGLDRVERWHLVWRVALHLRLPWRRRVPGGLAPYGGGAYWALGREAVEHVHDRVQADPALVRFFRHTLHPDELFLHTLLMSSELAAEVVPEHLHYVSWDADPGPKILGVDDLDAAAASGRLFARKFDAELDAEVLDLIDRRLLQERDVVAG
jgi:Core-2/I-Branching enzyme